MLSLATAKKIAISAGNKLLPFCDRLNIAGSIRRGKQEVGDIELVCQPKRVKVGLVDLFGQDTRKEEVSAEFIKTANSLGKVIKGKGDGRMMQIELDNPYGGVRTVMLDLFMPMPYDYYRIFAIRTGSADYSAKIITGGWIKRGWRGTVDGLRLEIECAGSKNPEGKVTWKCITDKPNLPPVWNSEEEFFDWIGVQFIPPAIRYVTR